MSVNYTITERELLSIVETLKEFQYILLGQQIKVYTDDKRLTCKIFNIERVMQWRLILEEQNPELIYIQDSNNIAADALSRLDIVDTPNHVEDNIKSINEHYGLEDISHPTNFEIIMQNEQKDRDLIKMVQNNKDFSIQNFHGADKKYSLICDPQTIRKISCRVVP